MGGRIAKILKQAYRLVRERRSLRLAGLFLVWPNLIVGSAVVYLLLSMIETTGEGGATYYPNQIGEGDPVIGAISIALIIVLVVLYFRFRAYVPIFARRFKDKRPFDPKQLWAQTGSSFWPLFGMAMAFISAAVIFLTIVSIPIANLASSGHTSRALSLSVIAVVLFSPVAAVYYLSMTLAALFLAGFTLSSWDSFRASLDLVRKVWRGLMHFAFVMLLMNFIGLVASIIAAGIVAYPVVLLGRLFYDIDSESGLMVIQGLAGGVGSVVFFMSQALVTAFSRTAWAVMFFEIIRPVKKMNEAEQAEATPEIAPAE